ncbi:hypothetical protein ACEN2J_17805 [Pseudorhodobacter sp. W20_MBD10_FR17]|uniref:RipA family octameric membrane protein n=1 Tax=Pseudorhodobacter sp. W20_MBD10_FR17 TaxID=3240266 RepID=UPI003F9CD518
MSSEEVSFNNKPLTLEIYLKIVDSIEKNIDRRYQLNRFNLSVLGALAAAFGFIQSGSVAPTTVPVDLSMKILATISSVTCLVWIFQVLRFREISRIKHQAAMRLEVQLQVLGITLEDEIEQESKTLLSYTLLELFFPVVALIGSAIILLSI